MNDIRKLVSALAGLPKEQVEKIVRAADASRNVEQLMSGLAPAPTRKKRAPNKAKVEAVAVTIEAPKRPGRPRKDAPVSKPLSSALDRLAKVKAGGVKARRVVEPDDED